MISSQTKDNLEEKCTRVEHSHEEAEICLCPNTYIAEEICQACSELTTQKHDHEVPCSTCDNDQNHHDHEELDWTLTILSGLGIISGIILDYLTIGGVLPKILLMSAILVEGYKPAISGIKSLRRRVIGIDLLMTIAATGAVLIGEFTEGALVLFLKDISLKLEVIAANRARHAIQALMKIRPETALIKRNGEEVEVAVEHVLPGEVFIVKPGDRIPLDGTVVDGNTTVDQSMMTGESIPIHKSYLDDVFAGTINLDGVLAVKTIKTSSETVLSNILRMVYEAEERKSPTETLVNRFAKYYTPLIVALATIIAFTPPVLFGSPLIPSVYNGLVLLVIGCPCALTIATPVAMVSALTSASRNGVLIKGSTFIEEINKAKVFAFDKTGTLTQGKLVVTDVIPYGVSRDELISIAATLEENSKHPIADAVRELAERENVPIMPTTDFQSTTGKGVEAKIEGEGYCIGNLRLFNENNISCPEDAIRQLEIQGKTTILVAREDDIIGIISLQDVRRTGAKEAVSELKENGMTVEMLTGDNETTAQAIAEQLGFNGYHANLLPNEKLNTIESLKTFGSVVMVGDGVNDAPALAAADIGIAMGGLGSDIALETADIVLLEDNLTRLNYIQRLSLTTLTRIRENIIISLGLKLLIVILASLGTISLWMSIILGDVGLTLLVILNSIRISGVKP